MNLSWLRFPENLYPNVHPWYKILWKMPWALVCYIGLFITYIAILMSEGKTKADKFWRHAV